MSQYSILAARLQQELNQINITVQASTSQAKKAQDTGDLDYIQAAALSLQNFYMGVERVFEEIAKQVDKYLPSGGNSDRELINQMGLEVLNTRPAVIQPQTLAVLDEYRAFRHVVIHRYGFELHPDRIQELVAALPPCYSRLASDLQDFCVFLLDLDKSQ